MHTIIASLATLLVVCGHSAGVLNSRRLQQLITPPPPPPPPVPVAPPSSPAIPTPVAPPSPAVLTPVAPASPDGNPSALTPPVPPLAPVQPPPPAPIPSPTADIFFLPPAGRKLLQPSGVIAYSTATAYSGPQQTGQR